MLSSNSLFCNSSPQILSPTHITDTLATLLSTHCLLSLSSSSLVCTSVFPFPFCILSFPPHLLSTTHWQPWFWLIFYFHLISALLWTPYHRLLPCFVAFSVFFRLFLLPLTCVTLLPCLFSSFFLALSSFVPVFCSSPYSVHFSPIFYSPPLRWQPCFSFSLPLCSPPLSSSFVASLIINPFSSVYSFPFIYFSQDLSNLTFYLPCPPPAFLPLPTLFGVPLIFFFLFLLFPLLSSPCFLSCFLLSSPLFLLSLVSSKNNDKIIIKTTTVPWL